MENELSDRVIVLVSGWCPPTKVDEKKARSYLYETLRDVMKRFPAREYTLVSGLKDVGVMQYAYRYAAYLGWHLVGVACEKVKSFRHYPVQEKHIVGKNWGDESAFFTDYALQSGYPFVMINVAGGRQATRETAMIRDAGGTVFEFPLERKKMFFDWEVIPAFISKVVCNVSFKSVHLQRVWQPNGAKCIHCGAFESKASYLAGRGW